MFIKYPPKLNLISPPPIQQCFSQKAVGTDWVSSKILKVAAPSIALVVRKIINLSISSNCFPMLWKLARVCPIFKSGKYDERTNYRAISILCVLSKILEKHIYNNLYTFLTQYNLIHLAQSGFRKFHSCETALAKLASKWAANMDRGDLMGLVLLDLCKAFDMVNHDILLHKLTIYRLNDNAFQ